MRRSSNGSVVTIVIALAVVAGVAAAAGLVSARGSSHSSGTPTSQPVPAGAARAAVVTVGGPSRSRAIPSGFLGLSLEYSAIESYAGKDPSAVDPVFEQLIRNLTPGQMPVLRIGGDTTDWSWFPVPHMARPAGVRINLDRRWLGVMGGLVNAVNARLILGINLEANNRRLSSYEARRLVAGLGRSRIAALEIGNEPELYGSLAWYVIHGQKFYGRPHSYNFTDYLHDIARMRAVLPRLPLAGPAVGGKQWLPKTGRFVAAEPRLGIVTLHRYPLQKCFLSPSAPMYPTIAHILAPRATRGLANQVAPYVRLAHAHRLLLRMGEMNSLSCGDDHRISDAFVSALWAVDALFEMARVGVDGVNIFSNPGAAPALFTFRQRQGRWTGVVAPDYYGLMLFAQAAPPGSRLLRVSGSTGQLKVWATRARDGRIRVVLIDKNTSGPSVVPVRVPAATGRASVERLKAPSLYAHGGVTLGGQSFGPATSTGLLRGRHNLGSLTPRNGTYDVRLRAGSAVMLTMAAK